MPYLAKALTKFTEKLQRRPWSEITSFV